ncbi:AaceriAGR118Wp [[Ashbya] aceris (nom. inval.)]|nr:AaceriAGR118Wp [[Ashbya] aceris (nom. inval.)]
MGRLLVNPIQLTAVERRICDVIRDYCAQLGDAGLRPRIAGGWVRDKLLGLESEDLDIVLNNVTGERFASGLVEFLKAQGGGARGVHKIQRNPARSKHLETCTTTVLGVAVDFVNLRSETYAEESRVPTVEFGTPLQDAMRRDATLNALFYNILEGVVEDFTGRGLTDLAAGVLRTPMPARQTFLDDPLRVLRLVRFAARFGFELDGEAREGMADRDIHAALVRKISRERVGTEVHKMLASADPLYGLRLLRDAGLLPAVFLCPDGLPQGAERHAAGMDDQVDALDAHLSVLRERSPGLAAALEDEAFRERFLLSTVLACFRGVQATSTKKQPVEAVVSIVREGLKLGRATVGAVQMAVRSIDSYHEMVENYGAWSRARVGLQLRGLEDHWRQCHYTAMACQYFVAADEDARQTLLDLYTRFEKHVCEEGLEDVHKLRPMIDGNRLVKLLGMKGGPWMSRAMSMMVEWQLENPNGTPDELAEWLQTHRQDFLP